MGDCPLVECAGRAYPVEITHREGAALHPSSAPRAIAAVCAAELRSLSQELPDKHILAFLPGAASIRATQELLSPLERPVLPPSAASRCRSRAERSPQRGLRAWC